MEVIKQKIKSVLKYLEKNEVSSINELVKSRLKLSGDVSDLKLKGLLVKIGMEKKGKMIGESLAFEIKKLVDERLRKLEKRELMSIRVCQDLAYLKESEKEKILHDLANEGIFPVVLSENDIWIYFHGELEKIGEGKKSLEEFLDELIRYESKKIKEDRIELLNYKKAFEIASKINGPSQVQSAKVKLAV